jgi:predicted nucleic acid-binding Zn ribbon protein
VERAEPRRRSLPRSAPARRRGPTESLSALLPKLLEEVGLGPTKLALEVIHAWDEALGPEFKSHCRPDGVKNGVIHARVRDSAWMQRIQLEKPRIFARLRAKLGDHTPRELRLRIGPL